MKDRGKEKRDAFRVPKSTNLTTSDNWKIRGGDTQRVEGSGSDMGGPPCCDHNGVKKGPWKPEEDIVLVSYIQEHGPGNWKSVPANTGVFFALPFHLLVPLDDQFSLVSG